MMPWIKVPAATITFPGTARILTQEELSTALLEKLYRYEEGQGRMVRHRSDAAEGLHYVRRGHLAAADGFPHRSRGRAPAAAA